MVLYSCVGIQLRKLNNDRKKIEKIEILQFSFDYLVHFFKS